jgi:uncharacterized repeat protein (TIGR02543 family)
MKVFIKKKHLINVVNKMREEQETTDESNVLVSDKYLKDIAEAIRMVKGITNNIKPKDFASYLGASLHNITFDGNGGTGGIYHIATGNTLGDLPQSEQTGEVFDGWYTADGIKITSDTVVTDDVTYYAKWEVNS